MINYTKLQERYFKIANTIDWRQDIKAPVYATQITTYNNVRIEVKVHRVFPSSQSYSASSRKIQFHWVDIGDSGKVVTPFMHVGIYPTGNYATLEPL